MTNAIRPQDDPLLQQLQHARHALASARSDVTAKQMPPSGFAPDMLAALDAIAKSELKAGAASQALRVTLLSKRPEAWALEDLDQLLARLDEALVEMVTPS